MRIAHVMLSRLWGGAERFAIDQVREVSKHGVDQLIVLRSSFSRGEDLADLPGVTVARIPAVANYDVYSYLLLGRVLRRFEPDLIDGSLVRGTWMGGRAARALGVPGLSTLHNPMKAKYATHIDYFTVHTRAAADRIVGWGRPPENVRLIPNFSTFPPAAGAHEDLGTPPTFVAMGRFVHKKGFDILISALRVVLERYGPVTLRLAGSGELQSEIEGLIATLDLGSAVELVPWVEDVMAFLRTGDVFVLPSRIEPFGIVMLEAMAAGLPVVAAASEGPAEVLADDLGYLCDLESVDDLARAMLESLNNWESSRERAAAGLERYRTDYHADAVIPRHISWWEEIVRRTS